MTVLSRTYLSMIIGLILTFAATSLAQPMTKQFFPYAYTTDDLANGLRLITVPTSNPNLVALYIVVQTGSRNEAEPGKSGYAHFFEHMMFRGSEHFTSEERDAILQRAGASVNAYTADDRTVYHTLFSKEDLERVMELEADRFQRLKYAVGPFKTESQAVLGEYNKNSADPLEKLEEVMRATAFDRHTYKHTTMGFLKDIEDMPNQYDYSLMFYRRFYRPEYATLLIVGDVTHDETLSLAKRYFGDWKRGDYASKIEVEPPQIGPRVAQVLWPSPTLPHLAICFHGPAYSDSLMNKPALDLLLPIAFGENSELYQRLVLNQQKIDLLTATFEDLVDPELFSVVARVKEPGDIEYVRTQILATFAHFASEKVSQTKLNQTRSRLRYGTALSWDSTESIAQFLATYVGLRRSPATLELLFGMYDRVTPEDIRAMAAKYFTESNRTVVTLQSQEKGK